MNKQNVVRTYNRILFSLKKEGNSAIYYMDEFLRKASQVAKSPPANAGSIPGSGRYSGGRNSIPLQYSCLENPTDTGAWRATVHRYAESTTAEAT